MFEEVAQINEQKFLAELGKLLTFMYEEDRQTAIKMYSDMFAAAVDEHALLLFLVSPTRQAVMVARAYNAKERKLQVHAQYKNDDGLENDPDEVPDYVLAIAKIAANAALICGGPPLAERAEEPESDELPVQEGQFSLFDNNMEEPVPPQDPAEAEPQPAPQSEEPAEDALPEPAPDAAADEAPAAESTSASEPEDQPAEDAEDEFAESFAVVEPPEDAEPPAQEALPAETVAVPEESEEPAAPFAPIVTEMVRRPRVLLLILFTILAIPVTLIGVVLLLIPTALCLALAASFIVVGAAALTAAFAGFAVLADILVMLGASIVGLALGLLFLWLFVWFIGGAIAGLIRGVVALGGSWCYKEVPAV